MPKIKNKTVPIILVSIICFSAVLNTGCSRASETGTLTQIETSETSTDSLDAPPASDEVTADTEAAWSESTHSNDADPNYELVFDQSTIMEFNIVIDPEDWAAMQADLQGSGSTGNARPGREGGNRQPPANNEGASLVEKAAVSGTSSDPIWVASTITFNDTSWDHVGIRFKGNSSLKSAVSSGIGKLSFKLDFDEFEDEYPEINNQRFYGFKQLNLNNNYSDQSLMREKVAADLFREFGLVSSQTTFCIVNVDYGEGSQYFGVYTLVEEMDDTVIEEQFGDDSGNLYKPEGSGASFAYGSFDPNDMNKKNNEEEGDDSDVEALYQALHDSSRKTDPAAWRAGLEEVFNVDGFLKWLAVNTVIQNWDTYGNMTHNYYLYHDPETDLLNWIPWDNNEAFSNGKGNRGALSLDLSSVGVQWPLISFLIDDPEYKALYDEYLQIFTDEVFTQEKMTEIYSDYYETLKEYAYDEVSGYSFIRSDDAFDAAVETLKDHVAQRKAAVDAYLADERG